MFPFFMSGGRVNWQICRISVPNVLDQLSFLLSTLNHASDPIKAVVETLAERQGSKRLTLLLLHP